MSKSTVRAVCWFPCLPISSSQEPKTLLGELAEARRWPKSAPTITDKAKPNLLRWPAPVQYFVDVNRACHMPAIEPGESRSRVECAHHDQSGLVSNPVLLCGVRRL